MRDLSMSGAAALAGVTILATAAATTDASAVMTTTPEVESFDASFGSSDTVTFNGFNPALGTLTGVTLNIDAALSFEGVPGTGMIIIDGVTVFSDSGFGNILENVDLLDPTFPFGTGFFTATSTFDAMATIGPTGSFFGDLTLTYAFEERTAVIPLPAGLPLLLTGVLALGAAGFRRRES